MRRSKIRTTGFSLVEVIVVISVTGILLAILIPAIVHIRASARSTRCKSNLRQIGLATHAYIDVHEYFPGGIYRSRGPLYDLLSYMDQTSVYRQAEAATDQTDRQQRIPLIPAVLCPDDPVDRSYDITSYLVKQGVLPAVDGGMTGFSYQSVKVQHVEDGLSSTAFFSESTTNDWRPIFVMLENPVPVKRTRSELNLLATRCLEISRLLDPDRIGGFSSSILSAHGGYNHLLPPNTPACSFSPFPAAVKSSLGGHSGGVNVLFADGAVRFVNENIDRDIWWNVGSIDGGEPNVKW